MLQNTSLRLKNGLKRLCDFIWKGLFFCSHIILISSHRGIKNRWGVVSWNFKNIVKMIWLPGIYFGPSLPTGELFWKRGGEGCAICVIFLHLLLVSCYPGCRSTISMTCVRNYHFCMNVTPTCLYHLLFVQEVLAACYQLVKRVHLNNIFNFIFLEKHFIIFKNLFSVGIHLKIDLVELVQMKNKYTVMESFHKGKLSLQIGAVCQILR